MVVTAKTFHQHRDPGRPASYRMTIAIPGVALGLLAIRAGNRSAHWSLAAAAILLGLCLLVACCTHSRWRFPLATAACVGLIFLARCFGHGVGLPELENQSITAVQDRVFPVSYSERLISEEAMRRNGCVCSECLAQIREDLRSGYLQAGHVAAGLLLSALSGLMAWGMSGFLARREIRHRRAETRSPLTPLIAPAAGLAAGCLTLVSGLLQVGRGVARKEHLGARAALRFVSSHRRTLLLVYRDPPPGTAPAAGAGGGGRWPAGRRGRRRGGSTRRRAGR